MVGHERHITNQKGLSGASRHGFGVVDHLVHGYREGGRVTEHHHSQAVADQEDRDTRFVENLRAEVVVGREHRETTAFILESLYVQDRCH